MIKGFLEYKEFQIIKFPGSEIMGNLRNVKNWKTPIILGNSLGKGQKIGDIDNVGYIGIGLATKTIVPIAHADEHRAGYDFIHYAKQKKMIPEDKYFTIYTRGSTFIDERDAEKYIDVFAAAKEFGLDGRLLIRTYDGAVASIDRFLSSGGFTPYQNGSLTDVGQYLIDSLTDVSVSYLAYLEDPMNKAVERKFKKDSDEFLEYIDLNKFSIPFNGSYSVIDEALVSDDPDKKADLIFGFDGVKNSIHKGMKNIGDYDVKRYQNLFGNLEEMVEQLNKIGSIKYQKEDIYYDAGDDLIEKNVYLNPDQSELKSLPSFREEKILLLRGLYDVKTGDVYVADAMYNRHPDIADKTSGIDPKDMLMFYVVGNEFSPAYTDDDFIIPPYEVSDELMEEIERSSRISDLGVEKIVWDGNNSSRFYKWVNEVG